MSESPHQILGVPLNATEDQIKKAYKQKALLYHPDKNPTSNTSEQFLKISDAYKSLLCKKAENGSQINFDDFDDEMFFDILTVMQKNVRATISQFRLRVAQLGIERDRQNSRPRCPKRKNN